MSQIKWPHTSSLIWMGQQHCGLPTCRKTTKADWKQVKKEFVSWQSPNIFDIENEWDALRMLPTESTEDFISKLKALESKLKKSDADTLSKLKRSLLPHIAQTVHNRTPASLNDAITYAREAVNFNTHPSAQINALNTQLNSNQNLFLERIDRL